MTYTTAIFYFFAAILVFAGLRVITARNPVHAVLYLVLAFFTAAGIWLLLRAEFLAIAGGLKSLSWVTWCRRSLESRDRRGLKVWA